MKYFVKLFVITFFLLSGTYTYAEQNFAYIDMKSKFVGASRAAGTLERGH